MTVILQHAELAKNIVQTKKIWYSSKQSFRVTIIKPGSLPGGEMTLQGNFCSAGFYLNLLGFISSCRVLFLDVTKSDSKKILCARKRNQTKYTREQNPTSPIKSRILSCKPEIPLFVTAPDFNRTRYSSKPSFRFAKIKPCSLPGKKKTLQDFLFPLEAFFLVVEPTRFFLV